MRLVEHLGWLFQSIVVLKAGHSKTALELIAVTHCWHESIVLIITVDFPEHIW